MEPRLILLPRYLKTFGLWTGLKSFVLIELFKQKKIKMPGIRYPFLLRNNGVDIKVFHEIFLYQIYKFSLDKPLNILDGGANIGLASIYFANLFPNARIIAVEPEGENFEILRINTAPYSSIQLVKSGLWPVSAYLKIKDYNENSWAFQVEETTGEDENAFRAKSITEIMNDFDIRIIDLIKLDIEGAERELFQSNYEWINNVNHILIELHDWMKKDASQTVFRTISKFQFTTRIINGMLLFSKQN